MAARIPVSAVCLAMTLGALPAQGLRLSGPIPATARLGGGVSYEISIDGEAEASLVDPDAVDGLRFEVGPPSTSSMTQIFNGRVARSLTMTWRVTVLPDRVGEFIVPAFRVKVGSETLRTRKTSIVCVEDLVGKSKSFVEVLVRRSRVFVNEPIDFVVRFGLERELYRSLLGARGRQLGVALAAPWASDFALGVAAGGDADEQDPRARLVALNDGHAIARQLEVVRRGELDFQVFELRRRFLANRAGRVQLARPAMRFEYGTRRGRDLFGNLRFIEKETGYARGNEVEVEVVPLPDEGRPADFRNAVGQFTLDATLARRKFRVGENVKLTLRLSGKGNFEFVELPELDDLPGFHRFGRRVSRGASHATAVYELAAVDDSASSLPAISLAYFDPAGEPPAYRFAASVPIPIEVEALPEGGGLEPLPDASEALTPGVDDIFDRMPTAGPTPAAYRPAARDAIVAFFAPLLALLGLLLVVRRRDAIRREPAILRRKRARARFGERLGTHAPLPAFAGYLADRFDWEEGSVLGEDLRARLSARGLPDAVAEECVSLLAELQEARYGTTTDEERLGERARASVDRLEGLRA